MGFRAGFVCGCVHVCVCASVPAKSNVFNVCLSHQFCVKEQRRAINKDAGSVGHSTNRIVGIQPPTSLTHTHTHTHIRALKMFIGSMWEQAGSKN